MQKTWCQQKAGMKSISPGLKTQCSTVASLKRGNLSWSGESRLICKDVIQDIVTIWSGLRRTQTFQHLTLNSFPVAAQWIWVERSQGVSNQSDLVIFGATYLFISGILFDDEVRSGYHSMKAKLYFDKDMKQKSHDTTCTQSSSDQYQSAL